MQTARSRMAYEDQTSADLPRSDLSPQTAEIESRWIARQRLLKTIVTLPVCLLT
jgi:hypothetical protein